MKIKGTFTFIYTKHHNELVVVFYILSNINVVFKLNHPFLTHWNHYSWVAFYIHYKHMQDPIFTLEWISNFFHIFLAFNMFIWTEPLTFIMLKLLLTSCILHVLKYIETHVIQMLHITFNILYWDTHNLMPHTYIWMGLWSLSCLLNYQHLHMSWIIHFCMC